MISKAAKRANKKYCLSKKGKITNRKYHQTEKGKIASNKGSKKYRQTKKGKIAQIARTELNNLFKCGNISNNEFICAICGRQPIEKHHGDYDSWNCFIPLCNSCHSKIHSMEKRYNDKK